MFVFDNASREVFTLPGVRHQTLASCSDGLDRLELWMQTLEPGAETPVHYHECEEVVVILKGSGRARLTGTAVDFGPGTTLVIPPRVVHQLVNVGGEEMFAIAALSETPARAFTTDGTLIPLPWQATARVG